MAHRFLFLLVSSLLATATFAQSLIPSCWREVTNVNELQADDYILLVNEARTRYLNGSVSSGIFSTNEFAVTPPQNTKAAGIIQLKKISETEFKLYFPKSNNYFAAKGTNSGSVELGNSKNSSPCTFIKKQGELFIVKYTNNGNNAFLKYVLSTDRFNTYSSDDDRYGNSFRVYKYYRSASLPITQYGWATYTPSMDINIESQGDVKLYYVKKGSVGAESLTVSKVPQGSLKAGTGVLVKATPDSEVKFNESNAYGVTVHDKTSLGNLLEGTIEGTNLDEATNAYIFTVVDGQIGFFLCGGGTLAAGRCYLQLPPESNAPEFLIIHEDETHIENIDESARPCDNQAVYNLSGQRVAKVSKGIFLLNGKKVAIK